MARKRTAVPEPVTGTRAKVSEKRFYVARPVLVEARKMMTIEPTAKVWAHIIEGKPLIGGTDLQGAFVRIQPPAEATDEHITFMREALKSFGAAEIRILPRPKASVVPTQIHRDVVHVSIRETVLAITETTNTKDLPALKALVETTLSKVGL